MRQLSFLLPLLLSASLVPVASASAVSVTVAGNDVVYAAGSQAYLATAVGGVVPVDIVLTPGTASLTFTVTPGYTVTLNGVNFNDAYGNGSAVASSSNTGFGSISGLPTESGAGFLTGVFTTSAGPSGSAPALIGAGFAASETPLLDQAFEIGGGTSQDPSTHGGNAGTTLTYIVPTGATNLYLGISDAENYNGAANAYGDNSGAFGVTVTQLTPEPSSLVLLGTGAMGLAGMVRRKLRIA